MAGAAVGGAHLRALPNTGGPRARTSKPLRIDLDRATRSDRIVVLNNWDKYSRVPIPRSRQGTIFQSQRTLGPTMR